MDALWSARPPLTPGCSSLWMPFFVGKADHFLRSFLPGLGPLRNGTDIIHIISLRFFLAPALDSKTIKHFRPPRLLWGHHCVYGPKPEGGLHLLFEPSSFRFSLFALLFYVPFFRLFPLFFSSGRCRALLPQGPSFSRNPHVTL